MAVSEVGCVRECRGLTKCEQSSDKPSIVQPSSGVKASKGDPLQQDRASQGRKSAPVGNLIGIVPPVESDFEVWRAPLKFNGHHEVVRLSIEHIAGDTHSISLLGTRRHLSDLVP